MTNGMDLPRFAELSGEYEIERELGRGGTAVVYLARERELGRQVAIKVIRATHIEDEEATRRLVREARTVAALQHPNIVVLYGTRRLGDGSIALIMQYVAGRTLKEEVAAVGPLPFARVQQILGDVGRALACAHRHRIVHRDVKPENIYLDAATGAARLSDFGIARPWDAESGLTLPGSAIGTPAYMSPEQIDGAALDGRSDLYSLGMIGYEMLTGVRPWAGENLYSIIYKQKRESLPPLAEVRPGIPPALLRALDGTLAKDPDRRWPDADRFLEALGERHDPLAGRPRHADLAGDATAGGAPTARALADGVTLQYRRDSVGDLAIGPHPARPQAELPEPPLEDETSGPRRGTRGVLAAAMLFLVLGGIAAAGAPWQLLEPEAAPPAAAAPDAAPPAAEREAAPTPAVAEVTSGAEQEALVGDTLPQPLVVRVVDEAGNPVAGIGVRFRIAAGAGALAPNVTATDATGSARTRWVLLAPGEHRVVAEVNGVEGRTEFVATATAPGPARLVAVPPTAAAEANEPRPLTVRVEDENGRPAAGARVRFTVTAGGGSIEPATAASDSLGVAQATWQPGPAGPQEAMARLADAPHLTLRFSAGDAGPPRLAVQAGLSVGGTHSCALASDGSLACWGGNDRGQLGSGTGTRSDTPVRVAAAEPFAVVAAGVSHTCAITTTGAAYCWGGNTAGQLGDGTRTPSRTPVRVATAERLVRVAAGAGHSCGLADAGALFCWGDNASGQLGDGTRTNRSTPVRTGGNRQFRSVSVGWSHTCALTTDGSAFCWGRNNAGQLGDGTTSDRASATPVAGGYRFRALAAGSSHTCGVRSDGTILCWGENSHGQLGNGSTASSPGPLAVAADGPFTAVALGALHSCGLASDGTALCWGRNNFGQLGDGTTRDQSHPVAVLGPRFTGLVALGAHSCGSAGGLWHCWGFNLEGQLGDGSRTNRSRPGPVSRLR